MRRGIIDVTSNTFWTVSTSEAWIHLSTTSGYNNGGIGYYTDKNTSSSSRTGTITFSALECEDKTFRITQSGGKTSVFAISPVSKCFTFEAASGSIYITADGAWSVSKVVSWITLDTTSGMGNGNVYYTVDTNNSSSSRSEMITFSVPGQFRIATINQASANTLAISPDSRTISANTNSYNISVASNTSWMVSTDSSWITLKTTSGSNCGDISYTVEDNPLNNKRTGKIIISAPNGDKRVFTITQEWGIVTSATSKNYSANEEWDKITVGSSSKWVASTDTPWIILHNAHDGYKGTYYSTLFYTVVANVSTKSRTGTITISAPGSDYNKTLTITQEGAAPTLAISPTSKYMSADSNSYGITVTSNTSWTVSKNGSWITLKNIKGSGNGTIFYTIAANTTSSSRTGTITISADGCESEMMTLIQRDYDTLNLKEGWQTLAFPYQLDNNSFERLKAAGNGWIYNNGKYVEIEIAPLAGIGFWYYATKATKLLISGNDTDIPKLKVGWNLISPAAYTELPPHRIIVYSASDNTYVLGGNSIDQFGIGGWVFIRK